MANFTVSDIMSADDMFEVSIDDKASDTSERVLSEVKSAIVEVGKHQPFAILSPESSQRLIGRRGSLRDYANELAPIGITTPDYSVERLMKAAEVVENVDAFLVMETIYRKGIIWVPDHVKMLRASSPGSTGLVDPPPGSSLCFCCPGKLPAGPHRVNIHGTEIDPYTRHSLCRVHRVRVTPRIPCRGC